MPKDVGRTRFAGAVTGRRLLAILASLAILFTSACATATQPTLRTLVVGASAEPASMDPTAAAAAAGPQLMLYNVYETLVKMGSDGVIRPLLATRWDVSDDRLTYTFTLNPAATFASGNPVTAQSVVSSIERIRDGNAVAILKTQMAPVASAVAVDPQTVKVTLKQPSNDWLFNMTSTAGMVFDPSLSANAATQTAGSGPYVLKAWNQGSSVVLSRNSRYWGQAPNFDEVTFRYFTDANAMNQALLAGDIDIISNVQAPEALSLFSDTSRFTTTSGTTNGEVVMGLNNSSPALSKLEVRQAITMAINRAALLQTVWAGKGQLIGSMVVPTDPWYEDLTSINPYDPAKARQLLAAAGYASGLTLRMRVPTLAYATKSAQFVRSQLAEVGITATIEELPFPSTWLDQVYTKGDYDITIIAHVEPRDIGKFADSKYYWHYNNPTFADLIKLADQASATEQVTLMKSAARILADDAAAVWLFMLPNLIVTKATITGVSQNATSLSFDLTNITRR